jgi:ferredoxin--NADP+ reductase
MTLSQSEVAALRNQHYNGTIISIREAHPELWIVRIRPDKGVLRFKSGQYTTLGLGYWEPRLEGTQQETLKPGMETKVVRRALSFSHPVMDDTGETLVDPEKIEFNEFFVVLVREKPGSDEAPGLTPRLFLLKPGDRVFIGDKVTGHYVLDPVKEGDDVIFGATGTGEAPHNPMIWELLRKGHKGLIISLVCNRYEKDHAYRSIHERLTEKYKNYRYMTLTTREPKNKGKKVYVQDFIESGELEQQINKPLDPKRTHFFFCGNPSMIGIPKYEGEKKIYPEPKGVVEVLEKRGFQADYRKVKGNIHFEEYW